MVYRNPYLDMLQEFIYYIQIFRENYKMRQLANNIIHWQ